MCGSHGCIQAKHGGVPPNLYMSIFRKENEVCQMLAGIGFALHMLNTDFGDEPVIFAASRSNIWRYCISLCIRSRSCGMNLTSRVRIIPILPMWETQCHSEPFLIHCGACLTAPIVILGWSYLLRVC